MGYAGDDGFKGRGKAGIQGLYEERGGGGEGVPGLLHPAEKIHSIQERHTGKCARLMPCYVHAQNVRQVAGMPGKPGGLCHREIYF